MKNNVFHWQLANSVSLKSDNSLSNIKSDTPVSIKRKYDKNYISLRFINANSQP